MSAFWPTSVATNAQLYIAVNSLQTTLSGSIDNVVTTITLGSTTGFQTAGAVTIDSEVIFYTGISGAQLTGCTRGADGTTAASHSSGVPVGATVVAFHHNGLKDEIIALETSLNFTASRAIASNSSGRLVVSTATDTELGYLSGVTSSIQTQLNGALLNPSSVAITITPTTNQLILGTTRTVTINAPTPATSSRTWTLPDLATSPTFAALEGTQTFSGSKTFSAALSMGSNKITSLADGTTATDALAFGQRKVIQIQTATTSTRFTTTSGSFQNTSLAVTITPTSSSNRILLIATGSLTCNTIQTDNVYITFARDTTNLGGTRGFGTSRSGGTGTFGTPSTISYIDSPASTSAISYKVQIRSDGGGSTVQYGDASGNSTETQSIIAIEVV